MKTVFLLTACLAPVPEHLFPPESESPEIAPGFRWYYEGDILRVTHESGDLVWFANDTRPDHGFLMLNGYNVQTRKQTEIEAKKYGRPKRPLTKDGAK